MSLSNPTFTKNTYRNQRRSTFLQCCSVTLIKNKINFYKYETREGEKEKKKKRKKEKEGTFLRPILLLFFSINLLS